MILSLFAPASLLLASASASGTVVSQTVAPIEQTQAEQTQAEAALLPEPGDVPEDASGVSASLQTTPVTHRADDAKRDPLEGFNRVMFGLNNAIDKALIRPAAIGYKHVVPKPARSGIRNVLLNLEEPLVFLNFLLQGKPGKAAETLGRFVVNTTVGIGGLVDVAKRKGINLPHRHNDFGSTLALWGVGPGPYFFLPLVGPTTLRDIIGEPITAAVLPVAVGYPFDKTAYQLSSTIVGGLDQRAEADEELKALYADAIDRYATLRSVWLQNRAAELEALRGHDERKPSVLPDALEDPLADPATAPQNSSSLPMELRDPLEDPDPSQSLVSTPEVERP